MSVARVVQAVAFWIALAAAAQAQDDIPCRPVTGCPVAVPPECPTENSSTDPPCCGGCMDCQPMGATTITFSTSEHATIVPPDAACTVLLGIERSVTTSLTEGPGTILVGEDQSQTCFVPNTNDNLNYHTHLEYFYQGVPCRAGAPTMSVAGYAALAGLLVALPAFRLWRRRDRSPSNRRS
jgi:hypothetical protein